VNDRTQSKPRALRLEVWIPVVYAAASIAWIVLSDLLLATRAHSVGDKTTWSILKGIGFVAVTSIALHVGVRWALRRERRATRLAEASGAALQESEERYRSLFELSADAIVAVDVTGRFTDANPAALKMLGYTREELLELSYQRITPARWLAMNDAILREEVPVRGSSDEYEKEYVRKDGTAIPVSLRAFVKKDLAGKVVGSWAIVRDVSERKRIEKELVERADMAALSADVGMAVTQGETLRGILQRCAEAIVHRLGAAFARIWIHGPEQGLLVLQASAGLYTHIDGPHGRVPVGKLKIGTIAEQQKPHLTNDVLGDPLVDREWARREGMVSFAGYPLLVGGKLVGTAAMFARHPLSDVALKGLATIADAVAVAIQRGLAEAGKTSAEEQFRQAQKLESVGRLAGGIAHDFNNLLTVILSGAEALKHDLGEGVSPDPEIVEEIGAAGARARDLTQQLLAFARRQVIAPVPFDLNALVRSSENLLRRVLGEDVELGTTLQPALWPARCDPGQIEQVVLNLAVNARDAMPRGGKLTIETSNLDVDETHRALFTGIQPGPYVRLAIHDSGIGMSPEVQARAFEPFFTTKPVGQGTGLGLATVYGIVNQSGGFIRVESEPGHGSTFELLFPRILEAAVAKAPPGSITTRHGTETVLVVEDDPRVREVTVRSLRAGGYLVRVASDGREALDVGARERGSLHLLVTDVVMPGLDGRAVADELRRHHPALRVLYVSGHAEEAIVKRGVLEPGIDLLPKPFTASSLLTRVRAVLDAP